MSFRGIFDCLHIKRKRFAANCTRSRGSASLFNMARSTCQRRAQVGEQMMVFWFVFLLLLVGGGIYAGVYIFFGSEYDFRKVDAEILNYRVEKCLIENEIDFGNLSGEIGGNFYEKCRLNQGIINETFFILVNATGKEYEAGPGDRQQCSLGELNDKYLRCKGKTFVKNGKEYSVLTGSNQILVGKAT
jgi:hypothetical protein